MRIHVIKLPGEAMYPYCDKDTRKRYTALTLKRDLSRMLSEFLPYLRDGNELQIHIELQASEKQE